MRDVIDRAEEEAKILEQGGVNGIIVENFGDIPFQTGRLDPETVAGMTVAVERVQRVVKTPWASICSETTLCLRWESLR